MRRLALALAVLTALPLTAATAAPAPEPVTTWVVERISPAATQGLVVRGWSGAHIHDYAFAAVASATVGKDGRFASAEGALFFGVTTESGVVVRSPAGGFRCDGLPSGGTSCTEGLAGGGIAFAVSWTKPTFNRVLVVIRGTGRSMDLGRDASPGWRVRRWAGTTRVVAAADLTSADGPLGTGAAAFNDARSAGGPDGSIAIGHPPCRTLGYGTAGTGAVLLTGDATDVVSTCPADMYPPAAASPGGTEWRLTGAGAGVSDVPARLVVVGMPARKA
ncbi:MAG: hypothetical protein QOE45_342 [Frankiaceae bacterium]|nr:hypothetical protein [Frankiaceae bacterium]